MNELKPGTKVRLRDNPARMGIIGVGTEGSGRRLRLQVFLLDGTEDHFPPSALDPILQESNSPTACFNAGRYSLSKNLRTAITHHRLSGKLANLIYSLKTTNTDFYPHQFKPVLQFLDSPSNGILIADEVGLGKTIEAGLIWTELRARFDARRLLVICPAVLRNKWREELLNRFGIKAELVNADELRERLESVRGRPMQDFALIASMQGLRPPSDYDALNNKQGAAKLARFLEDADPAGDPLLHLLVIDEAHYLRNTGTKTNLLGHLLRPLVENLVLLSATPIQLADTDLFNLLKLLDESAFPHEYLFDLSMAVTRPIVQLRDAVLAGRVNRDEFCAAIRQAMDNQFLDESAQLASMLNQPPSDEELKAPHSRSEIADRLDRVHPLSKVVTRTLKREVQENRVIRVPLDFRAPLNEVEQAFYDQVTQRVREYCQENGLLTGFILTTPQRQMASCMPAACRAWQEKLNRGRMAGLDEAMYELSEDESDDEVEEPPILGSLIEQLVEISQSVGDYEQLRLHDSKYRLLREHLRKYCAQFPGKKIVLFSFFRQTLAYLHERLSEDGISCVVLQGGDDKDAILRAFKADTGPQVLLSSEVGSEGVDLQFSALLVNYDLPWNPMKIEQRIGRIDRLGQQSDKILIWNLMYANTIDERIYDRLLMRLDIFRQALGSMESIIGRVIKKMTKELFSHQLSPEEETLRIENNLQALAETKLRQERLEAEAPNLVAHGDFIMNKVRAAEQLGRYVRSDDLHAYVTDFILDTYPGTRFIPVGDELELYSVELSMDLRVQLSQFIQDKGLQGHTQLLDARALPVLFENCHRAPSSRFERVAQDHPLVRFVTSQLGSQDQANQRYPISAVQLSRLASEGIEPGIYAFVVSRWSFSGAQTNERLVYAAKELDSENGLEAERAEQLVNLAALAGEDWPAAKNLLVPNSVVDAYEECRGQIADQFRDVRQAMRDENNDRVNLLIKLIRDRCDLEVKRINERMVALRQSGKERMIPAEKGKRDAALKRREQREAELRLKQKLEAENHFVTAGVIKIG